MITAVACVPQEDENAIPRFERDTAMGAIQASGVIKIGVPANAPPLSYRDGRSKNLQGFTVELGGLVARALGVKAQFIELGARTPWSATRIASLLEEEADLVFPLKPITERAVRQNSFTDPYYVAHQRLLVSSDSPIDDVGDLDGTRVCSYISPATELSLDRLTPGVSLIPVAMPQRCASLLARDKADAATAADLFLIGMRFLLAKSGRGENEFVIAGDSLTTEGYGAVVDTDLPGLGRFFNTVLAEAKEDGRWTRAYNRWVAPYTNDPYDQPPTLSLQEAAALFPSGS